ncbi:MAG TPA: hypothetical protein DCL44_02275 [Elusimicrobia bacterium]|nr:hypothetical protein [Elusimicrobiota bacterium]
MEIKYRKHIRLRGYDYKTDGCYFATICADYGKSFFNNPQIRQIVVAELALLPKRFPGLKIDYYVTMPNHVHVIFVLEDSQFPLARIIQAFKSVTNIKSKASFATTILWRSGNRNKAVPSTVGKGRLKDPWFTNGQNR